MLMDRIARQQAEDLLRHCLESGQVIPGRHFRDKLAKESITIVDAWFVLKSGRIFNEPEFHVGSQEWNYRVEGHEPGGKWLAVVFSFKSQDSAFLVTVFSIEAKRR